MRAEAGIGLHRLVRELHGHGLAFPNLGDIDVQSLAGALVTGTHGTGGRLGNLASGVEAMELVLADGSEASVRRRRRAARRARLTRRARSRGGGHPALRALVPPPRRRPPAPARGRARLARRARRGQRPLRAVHVPALAARAHAHEQPHGRAADAAAARGASGCRTSSWTTTRSGCSTAPPAACRARSRASTGRPAARPRSASAWRSPTTCSRARGSCASRRWSTRCRGRAPRRRCGRRGRSSRATRSRSRSSCASRPATTRGSRPRTGATPPTSRSTCSRAWRSRRRSARSRP